MCCLGQELQKDITMYLQLIEHVRTENSKEAHAALCEMISMRLTFMSASRLEKGDVENLLELWLHSHGVLRCYVENIGLPNTTSKMEEYNLEIERIFSQMIRMK